MQTNPSRRFVKTSLAAALIDKPPLQTADKPSLIATMQEATSVVDSITFHIGNTIAAPIASDKTRDITIQKKILTACPILENNSDSEYLNSIPFSEAQPHIICKVKAASFITLTKYPFSFAANPYAPYP